MTNLPSLEELLKKGVHFGHKTSKRHPKMSPFIFTKRNGVHVIDLEATVANLRDAIAFVEKITKSGGTILFIGSKKQAKTIVREAAENCDMPYIVGRWLGGTFTNFNNIVKLTKKLETLTTEKADGTWDRYTKKEQVTMSKQMKKLEDTVGGIRKMQKLPEAVFVVDIKKEKTAVMEANKVGLPIVAMTDTNTNPEKVKYPIPANDDAIKSIRIITDLISEAIKNAKK
ncbi:30S ribosomal protein S2 [bacterium]|jgi:small subunit ribosomal protein S2|nr:30S ribosomal protein S2 [bacterium]MBT4648815.1 30S ribosomal protein S2 [bacterium]